MDLNAKICCLLVCLLTYGSSNATAVTCELNSTTFGVKKINPVGKTIFRAGERVEITCTETHWILRTKESIKSFTCQDDGHWDHEPVCEDIRCESLHDPHLSSTYTFFWEDRELGAKRSYSCKSEYDQISAVATCTRDGWAPNPLCEKMCAAPNIPNAEIVEDPRPNYRISSEIQYQCNTGFEPEEPVQITCNSRTEWIGIRQCTAKQTCALIYLWKTAQPLLQ